MEADQHEEMEKSAQKLVSKINPNLKFSRNYEAIRPHDEYCEEMIDNRILNMW